MTTKQTRTRWCALLLTLALVWGVLIPTAGAAEVRISVDDTDYAGTAQIRQGTTYVPMRGFFEFLGGWTVTWDAAARCATATSASATVIASLSAQTLQVGSSTISAPILLEGGHTYLPLRTLGTLLGYEVTWAQESKTAYLFTPTGTSWSEDDLYWMSRIISAEAGGEPLTGQVAVGNVVLNRVASSEYPNTIYDVIFDRKDAVQFEPVSNGTVYNAPSDASVQAAKLALNGMNVVGDCMFFFNPALSQGTWIVNNRTYYTTIGCHRFYR